MRKFLALTALALLLAPVAVHAAFALSPGHASYAVASGSMEPTVERGSVAYVRATGSYAVGDVVSFARGDRVVTHRIVAETPAGYVTKGDANGARDDRPVPEGRIVGEVVGTAPAYGYLLAAGASWPGRALLVGVPAVALLAVELRNLRRVW